MDNDGFKSRIGVVAAAAGSAVGLGNIWGFSYKAGVNGGGTFVLIYLFCVFFVGAPVLIAELILGREGKGGAIGAIENLDGKKSPFLVGGYMNIFTTTVILSFYAVIAGWAIYYLSITLVGGFGAFASAEASKFVFENEVIVSKILGPICQVIFMGMTIVTVMLGFQGGIEKLSKLLMPILFIIIFIMVIYNAFTPGFKQAVEFLFVPSGVVDGNTMANTVVAALGQSFFTLSLGMGVMIAYGRAIPQSIDITKTTVQVIIADTIVALMAGLAIFPIIFSSGLEASEGVGLAFTSLPVGFASMSPIFGYVLGNLFFILIVISALTSSISLLESSLTVILEKTKLNRKTATIVFGLFITAFGFLSQYGFGFALPLLNFTGQKGAFLDQLDKLTMNYTIPIGSLIITLFVGYRMKPEVIKKQINNDKISRIFIPYIKYVAPIIIGIISLSSILSKNA